MSDASGKTVYRRPNLLHTETLVSHLRITPTPFPVCEEEWWACHCSCRHGRTFAFSPQVSGSNQNPVSYYHSFQRLAGGTSSLPETSTVSFHPRSSWLRHCRILHSN